MFEGLMMALEPSFIFWLTVGVLLGLLVGTLPGLTATMGTALLVPFTFALPTGAGLAMLGGLYVCAMFSDAIPACLVNTPGTPAAMATGFDGHPMVLQGRGQEAIVGACFSSALGTLFGAACYLLLAWPMITIALKFGPSEFFWLGVFALTTGIATTLYLQVFRDAQARDEVPPLNQRAASLIGHHFTLKEPIQHGEGRVQIGDTFWRVEADGPLAAGTEVRVVGASETTLSLKPASA